MTGRPAIGPPGAVTLRLHGQPADVAAALAALHAVFPAAPASRPYPDRAGGRIRIYLTLQPADREGR